MRRALRIIGTVIALACLGALVMWQLPHLPTLDWSSPALWPGLLTALVCYVLSQLLAAEAWRAILSFWGVTLSPALARSQPLLSQIGKYIPGNVAHLFGRAVLGRKDGIGTGVLAAAMVLEVALILTVGIGLSVGLISLLPGAVPDLSTLYPELSMRFVTVSIAGALVIALVVGLTILRARLRALTVLRPKISQLGRPTALVVGSFGILGVSLWTTALAVAPDDAPGLISCTLVFALAWAAGFVVPGAPGGIGVRDGIIVLGLAVSLGEGTGLAVALLHRAVSVAGDVATFAIGWQMRRTHPPKNNQQPASFPAI